MGRLFAALLALVAVVLSGDLSQLPLAHADKPTITPYMTATVDLCGKGGCSTSTPPAASVTPTTTATSLPALTASLTTTPSVIPITATRTPSATVVPSTATTTATVAVGVCSQAIHDQYTTTGPDGQIYPTWHPAIDPSGCWFTHEHGDNPAASLANPTLPSFGYFDNRTEPHVGFKVHAANAGDVNNEGSVSIDNHRVVFHMGTGGPARFDTRYHSIQIDVTGSVSIHTGGMADTGGVGSICATPRPGKVVLVAYGCTTGSPYEIWATVLNTPDSSLNFSPAVFDPITVMDPGNHALLELSGLGNGCNREFYFGPYFGPWTDWVATGGLGYIATHTASGQPLSQYKVTRSYCTGHLGLSN